MQLLMKRAPEHALEALSGLLGVGALLGGSYFAAKLVGLIAPAPREKVFVMPGTKEAFVQDWLAALGAARPDTSVATRILVVAQGAYESGWGKTDAAAKGFNIWNLSAGTSWGGPVITGGDVEYNPGSTSAKNISQRFRAYGSREEAVLNYFQFLSSARYNDARAKLLAGDSSFVVDLGVNTRAADGAVVRAWPAGITKGGFYTLPIPEYVKGFNARLAEVQIAAQVVTHV